MSNKVLVVGFTVTNRAEGYVPAMDGYRPGAPQHLVAAGLPADTLDPVAVADGVYAETNGAYTAMPFIWPQTYRPLNVGDTIEIWEGMVLAARLACLPAGWAEIPPPARQHWYQHTGPLDGPGSQPDGAVAWDRDAGPWGAVAYPRPLTAGEICRHPLAEREPAATR